MHLLGSSSVDRVAAGARLERAAGGTSGLKFIATVLLSIESNKLIESNTVNFIATVLLSIAVKTESHPIAVRRRFRP